MINGLCEATGEKCWKCEGLLKKKNDVHLWTFPSLRDIFDQNVFSPSAEINEGQTQNLLDFTVPNPNISPKTPYDPVFHSDHLLVKQLLQKNKR